MGDYEKEDELKGKQKSHFLCIFSHRWYLHVRSLFYYCVICFFCTNVPPGQLSGLLVNLDLPKVC